MSLSRIRGYAVVKIDGGTSRLNLGPVEGCFVVPEVYNLDLKLEDGTDTLVMNISHEYGRMLQRAEPAPEDSIYYVLGQARKKGLNPFRSVREVRISTQRSDYNETCGLAETLYESENDFFGKKCELQFCRCSEIKDNSSTEAVLDDSSCIRLADAIDGLFVGSIYGCDMSIDGLPLRRLILARTFCDGKRRSTSIALDVDGMERAPLFSGANLKEALFLQEYSPGEKTHLQDGEMPRRGAYLSTHEFARKMARSECGSEVLKVDINRRNKNGDVIADVVTDTGKVRMKAMDAFVLSRALGKDVFLDQDKL